MQLQPVTPSMSEAHRAMSSEAFQRSAATLTRARTGIRESLQALTSPEILTVLERLRSGAVPSREDLDTVWLWIVGDAESYVRQENNFDDWVAEFDRLQGVLARFEGRECTEIELLELQGILEDAVRVGHDIAHYLEKRERIERFDQAVREKTEWTREDREFLVRILTGKLERSDV